MCSAGFVRLEAGVDVLLVPLREYLNQFRVGVAILIQCLAHEGKIN